MGTPQKYHNYCLMFIQGYFQFSLAVKNHSDGKKLSNRNHAFFEEFIYVIVQKRKFL